MIHKFFRVKTNHHRVWLMVLAAFAAAGCVHPKPKPPTSSSAIVTPDLSLQAKVISVNSVGRFVVLSFPNGQLPKQEQTMFLYRNGLKVAEVRVTGPQQENNIVADLVSGDTQLGDTVRDQ